MRDLGPGFVDPGAETAHVRPQATVREDAPVTELRVLTVDDWRLWRELRLVALAEAPRAFRSRLADWQGEGDREERWRARLGTPGAHHVVAMLGGAPAGTASGVPGDDDDVVELISMWIAPAARGRGVGDALVGEIARWGATTGAHTLRLDVRDGNHAANALYRRNGFRRSGRTTVEDGALEHEMVRPLGS